MKITGITDLKYKAKFRFHTVRRDDGTALELDLTALPWGWDAEISRELGAVPQPPHRKVGESNGQPIFRACPDDADYQMRLVEHTAMMQTAIVYLSLADDRSIAWDTSADLRKSDPKEFWKSIAREIKNSGWPAIEVGRLIEECSKLANAVESSGVEEAKRSFLSTDG